MNEETVFSVEPHSQAKIWENFGFKWIHVVDLNGAVEGKPKNIYAVQKIIHSVHVPVQLGGGIRNIETADAWIDAGISRLILGTVAIEAPEIVHELCKKYPGKIAVGIDAKKGMVATRGWLKKTRTKALDLAKRLEGDGVAAIIYTDIEKDGLLGGPNIEETVKLAESVNIPVILSGGISGINDVQKAKESGRIAGVVVGRALYSETIKAAELLAL